MCYINSSDRVLLPVMGPACSLWSPAHTSPMMQEGFESQTDLFVALSKTGFSLILLQISDGLSFYLCCVIFLKSCKNPAIQ